MNAGGGATSLFSCLPLPCCSLYLNKWMSEQLWALGLGVAGGPQSLGCPGHLHPSNPMSGPAAKPCGRGKKHRARVVGTGASLLAALTPVSFPGTAKAACL